MAGMFPQPKATNLRVEFPKKLVEKYRTLEEITYDFLTPSEREFLKAQVEEARRRKPAIAKAKD